MKNKSIKIKPKVTRILLSIVTMLSLTQCCSVKKLQAEAPATFGEVYYKNWVSGVERGGSGTNLFIEVLSNDIVLDSVYFRRGISKLNTKPSNPSLYIGRFLSDVNNERMNQITQESTTKNGDEYSKIDFPFELNEDECVVSYHTNNGKTKYYKLTDIIQKPSEEYPSAKRPDNG